MLDLDSRRFNALLTAAVFAMLGWSSPTNAHVQSDAVVHLRSGSVHLRSASSEALVKTSQVSDEVKILYLMKYTSGDASGLQSAVVSQGGSVVAYVPNDTLLVQLEPIAAVAIAQTYGALIAEYLPDHKISPEVVEVISSYESTQRRRRLQSGEASEDGKDASPSSPLLNYMKEWQPKGAAASNTRETLTGTITSTSRKLYGLKAFVLMNLTATELQAAFRGWPTELANVLGYNDSANACWPKASDQALYTSFNPRLEVYLCEEDIAIGTSWLAGQTIVTWVSLALRVEIKNAYAGWILQTGDVTSAQYTRPTSELRPYWRAGIRGDNIIVGVGDTGVDVGNCYFLDDKYSPTTLLRNLSGTPLSWKLPDHRKIVQYTITDYGTSSYFGDEYLGHGTHVCGSVAGSRPGGTDGFLNDHATGAAPMARISLMDFDDGFYSFEVPEPIHEKLLPVHYQVGARLSSDSWGSAGAVGAAYDYTSMEFDYFAWLHPDFLSVVAAGNDGESGEMATVTSPATAKNTLSVGASTNHPSDITSYDDQNIIMFRYRDKNGVLQGSAVWPLTRYSTGYSSWNSFLYNKEVPVALANPAGACSSLTNFTTTTIVLVNLEESTGCSYSTVDSSVVASGAAAVLYARPDNSFVDDYSSLMSYFYWYSYKLTYGFITKAQGRFLKEIISNSSNTNFHMTYLTYPTVAFGIDSVASFSSHGSYPKGLIKPDIVAPGSTVVSAGASGTIRDVTNATCSANTVEYEGTSMATPLTSGHLALMRQYFRDGFYPRGSKTSYEATPFEPSGMLLKAAVIAGAKSLEGGMARSTGRVLGQSPDAIQGWGRLALSGALPLPGLTSPNMRLQVADMGVVWQGNVVYLCCIRATGTGPIFATLVWHDYPAALQAASLLVNDLDFKYSVNGGPLSTTREDHTNNVERIELVNVQAGDNITLVVSATRIVYAPQRWAVAVVGHFTGTLKTFLNPSYATPQRLQEVSLWAVKFILGLTPGGGCLVVSGATLISSTNSSCGINQSLSLFTLTEETDGPTGGAVYMLTDGEGRCLTMVNSSYIAMGPCDSNQNTRLALFKNAHVHTSTFLLVPRHKLGSYISDTRMCLQLSSVTTGSSLTMAACDEDEALQSFTLIAVHGSSPVPPAPPPPPSPPPALPPPPSPPPPEAWLRFKLEWTKNYVPVTDDLDIYVAWIFDGYTCYITYASQTKRTTGRHEGNNNGTNYESVTWNTTGPSGRPDSATYHVCVKFYRANDEPYDFTTTVFVNGTIVKTMKMSWSQPSAGNPLGCYPGVRGYMGNYTYGLEPPPIMPWLMFRTNWSSSVAVSGVVIDADIFVAWNYGGRDVYLTYNRTALQNGSYGGDNRYTAVNSEFVTWNTRSGPPVAAEYRVCLKWLTAGEPFLITFEVFIHGIRVQNSSRKITRYTPTNWTCTNTSADYVASFWYPPYNLATLQVSQGSSSNDDDIDTAVAESSIEQSMVAAYNYKTDDEQNVQSWELAPISSENGLKLKVPVLVAIVVGSVLGGMLLMTVVGFVVVRQMRRARGPAASLIVPFGTHLPGNNNN